MIINYCKHINFLLTYIIDKGKRIMETKFKKFEPMSTTANQKINELIVRGGTIVKEKREQIVIQRMESFAKIDQYGRVEWTAELP